MIFPGVQPRWIPSRWDADLHLTHAPSPAAVEATAEAYSPAKLCTYLLELSSTFTTFYEGCRVLVDDQAIRTSRLAQCDLTARVLAQGLSLLGMDAPDQM